MVTINQVADFFISKIDDGSGDVMTHLRLQKLCYYAQAWHLANYGTPMFDGKFQAWAHGPVNTTLWALFKHIGWGQIQKSEIETTINSSQHKVLDLLEEVWKVYGQFSAKALENMTHEETPWKKTRGKLGEIQRCKKEISEKEIEQYYKALLEA